MTRMATMKWANQFYNSAYFSVLKANAESLIENLEMWKRKARRMLAEDKIAMDNQEQKIIEHFGLIYRPVDKRENYIKRCVAIPGDWIEIKSSVLYVNGKPSKVHPFQNLRYDVSNFAPLNVNSMRERFGLEESRGDYYVSGSVYKMNLTADQLIKMEKAFPKAKFEIELEPQYNDTNKTYVPTALDRLNNLSMFPKDLDINNTTTDFSRIQIPTKGQTIKISKDNIAWYRRIITAYEGHTLSERKDGIYIDGKKASTYTFAMNYYWLMGDNRYNSADSRVWGFVPEDHVVGKASLVWLSKSSDPTIGFRWERIFNWIE
jgi:signal peptidase I